MIGQTISHYTITAKLGAGGMGEVFLATDTKLDRPVALKFLAESLQQNPEARERLLREAKAASKLNHPNILTVHAVESVDGRDFIVMEYIEGRPVSDFALEMKPSTDDLLGIAIQIGEGLGKAHEAGVIHRDLKPTNILIDAEGRARILDFGVASLEGATRLTRTGSTVGTLAYMSPEQFQGQEADRRSDLFSFGAVLYEMTAGRPPFTGEHHAAVMYSVMNEEPPPLVQFTPQLPDQLQRIISRCLAKRPDQRYQSAADLVADLRCLTASRASKDSPGPCQRKMLAVLPFENLGPPEEEYFADGMTEEITSRLAAVRELGVISRTSARQYKDTHKAIREIGAELRVDYILEGTVRWSRRKDGSSRVRITPQLIHVTDDTHLWSERYDRVMDDIFAIQSDIAEQVFRQLNITLLEPERRALEVKPTGNIDAYHAYLRGIDYAGRPDYSEEDFLLAIKMFERAVELDSDFALAYAELSRAHSSMYFHGHDRTTHRLSRAKDCVNRAFALAPNLPEAHLALGLYYYRGLQDWDRALAELATAEQDLPNDTRLLAVAGAIRKRQGIMDAAVDNYNRAFELSPRDASLPHEIGCVYMTRRRYAEAARYYERSIALVPDQELAYLCSAWNDWLWRGDVAKSRATLESIPKRSGVKQQRGCSADSRFSLIQLELYARNYKAVLDFLANTAPIVDEGQWWFVPRDLWAAYTLHLMGQTEKAHARYMSALQLLETEIGKRPDDDRIQSSLGIVCAGLGRRDKAVHHGKRAVELLPVSRNAVSGPFRVEDLAFTYALVGEHDAALDQIEYLLSIPSWLSTMLLRLDPRWDPLRDHPRFKALLEQGDKVF